MRRKENPLTIYIQDDGLRNTRKITKRMDHARRGKMASAHSGNERDFLNLHEFLLRHFASFAGKAIMTRWKQYDKSRWQQDQERFHLTDSDPELSDSAGSIRQTIMDIFSRMTAGDQSLWRQVEQEWGHLVGPTIVRHARPVRLDRKTLVVAVDSSVWMNELIRYERAPILLRLQQQYGADRIRAIQFQADPRAAVRNNP